MHAVVGPYTNIWQPKAEPKAFRCGRRKKLELPDALASTARLKLGSSYLLRPVAFHLRLVSRRRPLSPPFHPLSLTFMALPFLLS